MASIESLIQRCTSLGHIKQLQAHLTTTGLFHSHPSRSKLLDFCATSSAGSLPYATAIFRQIPRPATNDWNAVIRGLAQSDRPAAALPCYLSMSRASCKPDALTCSFVLKACARALALPEAAQLHSHALRFGFIADVLLQTTLLDVYAKSGDLDGARQLFDEMPMRDTASWNALIAGLAQGNRPTEALELFKTMSVTEGLNPNEVTVLGALSACSQLGARQEGEKVFNYIIDRKLDDNVIVCNAVIDMYAKCGFVEKAYQVFNTMRCGRNLITWNTMIMALAMQGDGVEALQLFERMEQAGVVRDSVSYLSVLCACNHAGMVEDGVRLFESMAVCGVSPNVKHYGSVHETGKENLKFVMTRELWTGSGVKNECNLEY
ncbi:hypothetical protein RJ639_019088 [Escallonia herrerae]|uniref:Pentatricopeptide repeat-containing protein n=1 Tax=Escallonia herrerae TaxID=1293975 RepID=A0AA88VCT8_9ASTE|nr:hypothetical protein RJ639_019088 [Escallonia herrerae]